MATVLIEEVLMGLDDVRASLEEAVHTLEAITEDMRPGLGGNLKDVLERTLLYPLQSRLGALEALLPQLDLLS